MSAPRIHVVGAGLAGLAAAVRLAAAGRAVILHEAAPQAGGRCRAYEDATLGCRIDNGNHLLISGNRAAMDYLDRIGAAASLIGPEEAAYPFVDLGSGARWVFRPGKGRMPWWLFSAARRIPGTRALDYLKAARLLRAHPDQTVGALLDPGTVLFHRLWRPLAVAVLNTAVEEASAQLLARVLAESFARGGEACRPLVPRADLSQSLIDPALGYLRAHGAEIRLGSRLRGLELAPGRVAALGFEGGSEPVSEADAVVLAVPAPVAARLVPGLRVPDAFRAIVNGHFRQVLPGDAPLLTGVIGGTAEWVFRKREVVSVTVSAADALVDRPAETLAALLWRDVAQVFDLPLAPMPPAQIVKERRATFAATPAQLRRRPPPATGWANLVLAGDWTDTGLPATIEGAVRSGFAAAEILLAGNAATAPQKGLSRHDARAKVA